MEADDLHLLDPATARAYIRNLAINFTDPEDMSAFIKACDLAQAVLVHRLIVEHRYDCIKHNYKLRVDNSELQSEMQAASDKCRYASKLVEKVEDTFKGLLRKLDKVSHEKY